MLARHPTPELRSDPPPQGEGGYQPPTLSPCPEAGAKRHQKNEGGWSSRPRSFEALAMRGRLRMRGIVWSLRHELHTAPNGDPPALVPKRKPSATHLPLEGRGRREAAGGVRPHLRYAHGSPHPGAPLRPSPSRGGWMPAADPQPLSPTMGHLPRHRPSPPTSPLRGEVAAKRRVGVTTSPAASRFTPPRKLLASPSP